MKLYGMTVVGLSCLFWLGNISETAITKLSGAFYSSEQQPPGFTNDPAECQESGPANSDPRQEVSRSPQDTERQAVDPQAAAAGGVPEVDNTDLVARVAHLESRLEALERIVFATSQLTVFESQRRLKEAEQMLRDRRELFLKGLLAESAWQQDLLQVEILKRELSMAQAASIQKEKVFEIEVLQAKQRLSDAKLQFDRSQTLVNRGFATKTQLERDSRLVTLSQQQLDLAEQKLNAARDLESIKGVDQGELPPKTTPPATIKK